MLKKILKWTGIVIGSLIALLVLLYVVAYFRTEARANKQYTFNIQPLTIPTDSASYELGKHVAGVRGCNDCHGNGGNPIFDSTNPIALIHAANLTIGKGGINYTDEDWIRALRHGVGKDGRSLWFMPSKGSSAELSNKELGALIAYLKKLPPVDKIHPQKAFKPIGRFFTFLGKFPMFSAEEIDHTVTYPDEIKPEVTVAYGKYLAVGCQGCHGEQFKGNPSHGDGAPVIPNISSTGNLGKWTSDQFLKALQTGKTPDGRVLSDYMPWKSIGTAHNTDELKALYLYLHEVK